MNISELEVHTAQPGLNVERIMTLDHAVTYYKEWKHFFQQNLKKKFHFVNFLINILVPKETILKKKILEQDSPIFLNYKWHHFLSQS